MTDLARECAEKEALDWLCKQGKVSVVDVPRLLAAYGEAVAARQRDWRTMCIVEIAAENPSVAEYCKHWEERAEKAENKLHRFECLDAQLPAGYVIGDDATATLAVKLVEAEAVAGTLREALEKINAIRNSIVGFQSFNFSEHAYPLVAALDEAGFKGEEYPEAHKNVGTMLKRTLAAESLTKTLREELEAAKKECRRIDGFLEVERSNHETSILEWEKDERALAESQALLARIVAAYKAIDVARKIRVHSVEVRQFEELISTAESAPSDALNSALAAAREDERERNCKIVCFWCNSKNPLMELDHISANGHIWHKVFPDSPDDTQRIICGAEAIRRSAGKGE